MSYLERKTCPLPCKKMRKQNRSQCHHSLFRWYGAERDGQSKVHNWVVAQARELIHDQVISKTITNVMDVSPHHIHIRALSLPLGSSSWISLRIIVDCLGRIGSFRIVVIHIFITIHYIKPTPINWSIPPNGVSSKWYPDVSHFMPIDASPIMPIAVEGKCYIKQPHVI